MYVPFIRISWNEDRVLIPSIRKKLAFVSKDASEDPYLRPTCQGGQKTGCQGSPLKKLPDSNKMGLR